MKPKTITFRHEQILFYIKQDVSQTCLDEENTQNKDMHNPSKQKTPKKKAMNQENISCHPNHLINEA